MAKQKYEPTNTEVLKEMWNNIYQPIKTAVSGIYQPTKNVAIPTGKYLQRDLKKTIEELVSAKKIIVDGTLVPAKEIMGDFTSGLVLGALAPYAIPSIVSAFRFASDELGLVGRNIPKIADMTCYSNSETALNSGFFMGILSWIAQGWFYYQAIQHGYPEAIGLWLGANAIDAGSVWEQSARERLSISNSQYTPNQQTAKPQSN